MASVGASTKGTGASYERTVKNPKPHTQPPAPFASKTGRNYPPPAASSAEFWKLQYEPRTSPPPSLPSPSSPPPDPWAPQLPQELCELPGQMKLSKERRERKTARLPCLPDLRVRGPPRAGLVSYSQPQGHGKGVTRRQPEGPQRSPRLLPPSPGTPGFPACPQPTCHYF